MTPEELATFPVAILQRAIEIKEASHHANEE